MPDYDRGIVIYSTKTDYGGYEINYTIPEDGWIVILKSVASSGNLDSIPDETCQIKDTDGDELPLSGDLDPVYKGMSIYCKGGSFSSNSEEDEGYIEVEYIVIFYPFKKSS